MNVAASRAKTDRCTFAADEHAAQTGYYSAHFSAHDKHRERPFELGGDHRLYSLQPQIRATTEKIFKALGIQLHTFIGHGRSSQACCLNFILPFADKPEALS